MIDKVEYWLFSADEDLNVAKILFKNKKYLHMGFFCHLITEKALKAVVANVTGEQPPKIHHLTALSRRGKIYDDLSPQQLDFFEKLMPLQLSGRYPEYKAATAKRLNDDICKKLLEETEEFLCLIKQKLGK